MKDNVMGEVKKTFKPEFINRIDDIIVFHKLSKDDISNILDLQLKDIANSTKEGMNIDMTLDDKAREYFLKESSDEQYGARKLKRVLTDKLEDLLALMMKKLLEIFQAVIILLSLMIKMH